MARYEFVEGSSSKFWEITLAGSSFTTTYGKIGTAGQSTTKDWPDAATAKKEHDKLVAEKTKKGYVLAGGGAAAAPAAPAKPAAAPAPAKKTAKKAAPADEDDEGDEDEAPAPKKAPAAKAAPAPASAPAPSSPASSGAQRYELVEGTSSKFWEITLAGASFTTTYGKIGTAGQSTTKDWPDAATARKEHDKLVAEKTKKGYLLVGGAKAPAPQAAAADEGDEDEAPAPAKAKAKAAAPAPAPAAAAPAPSSPASSGAQLYELVEGSSSKFWEIKLEGTSFTTTYGKIGTAGQSATKSFKDEATARKEHDKLVAEKTKKGYSPAGGGGGGGGGGGAPAGGGGGGVTHAKAGTAFRLADLEQLHENPDKAETFMGLKIVDFDEEEGVKDAARRAWRINDEEGYDSDGSEWRTKFEAFLEQPGVAKVKAFVVGQWGQAMEPNDDNARALVETLAKAKDKLPELAALFLCDIASEEAEISWQHTSDVAPLLKAYPNLQHLRVRGSPGGGKLSHLQHDRLRSLQIEGSNITQDVFEQVGEADLPALEHLELWLGPDEYAGQKDVACLTPILSGKLFPALRYLGLRDSDIADDVAVAVAQSPIVDRLETLDLSLGNLSDRGAAALLASPSVAKLKRLDIRQHYVSAENVKRLRAHLAGGTLAESKSAQDNGEEEDRFVAVSE